MMKNLDFQRYIAQPMRSLSFHLKNSAYNKNHFWIASFTSKLHHGQILIGSYFMIITLED